MELINSVNNSLIINRTNGQQTLKDGSETLVRIIADKGNGKYSGSLGGVRVTINAKTPLTVGKSFVAVVQFKNGTVVLTPKQENIFQNTKVFGNINENHQINTLLNQIGLPSNQFSVNLLQQFKQLAIKYDSNLLNKLYKISIKFKGKEKIAAQLLSDLLKKGTEISEQELLNLINLLENNENWSEQKEDLLKLSKLNSIEKGWKIIPYEMIDNQSLEKCGSGILRILCDDLKSIKRVNLECNYNLKKYLFSCEYEKKELKNILFNVNPCENNDYIKEALEFFNKSFKNRQIEIKWCNVEEIEGTASSIEEIYSFNEEL